MRSTGRRSSPPPRRRSGWFRSSRPTYAEPFHTSSQLATLDYASRGRAAGSLPRRRSGAATAWGRPVLAEQADLDREQRESITVVRDLWDSWEDDAVIRDHARGRFLDRDRLHYVDFEGVSFTVKGPAIVPRPPQGQLVVFGTEVDREQVDVVLVTEPDRDAAVDAANRSRGLTFVEIGVTLDTPHASAEDRARRPEPTPAGTAATAARIRRPGNRIRGVAHRARGTHRWRPAVSRGDRRGSARTARFVLPALFTSGVAHRPVPGSSLRGNLGLARPVNRYAKV